MANGSTRVRLINQDGTSVLVVDLPTSEVANCSLVRHNHKHYGFHKLGRDGVVFMRTGDILEL